MHSSSGDDTIAIHSDVSILSVSSNMDVGAPAWTPSAPLAPCLRFSLYVMNVLSVCYVLLGMSELDASNG